MVTNYKILDEREFRSIYQYEERQLNKFKAEFNNLCLSIAEKNKWNYFIRVERWIDSYYHYKLLNNRHHDGYTAMLQVDFTDWNDSIIEIDENPCTFFENITFISYNIITRRYRVFQNEDLKDIRKDLWKFINSLDVCN